MDFFDTVEWEAKGMFETPTTDLTTLIEWDAKGAIGVTSQGEYKSTIEWTANGHFEAPKTFIFVDLR